MGSLPMQLPGQNIRFLKFLILLFLSSVVAKINLGSNLPVLSSPSSDPALSTLLSSQYLDGHFSFHDIHHAAKDFGNRYKLLPAAVLHPASASDISSTIRHIFEMGLTSKLTVAARGHGHSLQGQAQAPEGIVVNMESLGGEGMQIHQGEFPYVDASAGELWINVLHETLRYGLAPKSWTDYLHLTIGGTLSNAGISGQAFRHGPQISNVLQLEIVTGKGEAVNCSTMQNSDLFYGALGGLGQFGIITRARIALERAPKMVKWIRVLYSDFATFVKDQEMLIAAEKTFDYIEGFVVINRTGLLNNWRSSFKPEDPVQASQFSSDGRTLFCLELTKNFNPEETHFMNQVGPRFYIIVPLKTCATHAVKLGPSDQLLIYLSLVWLQEIKNLLSKLSFIPSTLFVSEVTYLEFLDRVHISEMKLRSNGLWEVPHPWLNLLIPRSKIHDFSKEVFGNILMDNSNGPILIYPLNKSKWDKKTSVITPAEDVFYLVAFLSSAIPSSSGSNSLEHILAQNKRILDFCKEKKIGMKQYLPHYTTQEDWQGHFGNRWGELVRRKSAYDPLAILAPGQRIFRRKHLSQEMDLILIQKQ